MNSVISNNLLYKPDFVLEYTEEELNELSNELSAEDEKLFEEILKLEEQYKGNSNFMQELLEATKKGTMQYLDAMTDTGETFNEAKRPNSVKKFDDEKNEEIQAKTLEFVRGHAHNQYELEDLIKQYLDSNNQN